MLRLLEPILTASAILLLAEAVLPCDPPFNPNTDKFTILAIVKIVGPIFVLGSMGLIVLNVIVFFQRRSKVLLGVLAIILAVIVQYVAVMLVISFDACLDYFPVLAIIEAMVLLPLTFKHLFMSTKNSAAG